MPRAGHGDARPRSATGMTADIAIGRHTAGVKLPTNQYDAETSERDVLLAIFEQLRGIRVAAWTLVALVAALLIAVLT